MGHHGGADDADGQVERSRIGDDLRLGQEAVGDRGDGRLGQHHLHAEADEDQRQQGDDEGFQPAKTAIHQQQDEKDVQRREDGAPHQRDTEQQIQRDGGADHLGQVAGDDGDLAGDPQQQAHRPRITRAAGLGQVQPGGDAQPCGQGLQQDGHEVGEQDHRQQQVAELRAAGQVRGPVARIHVAHRDHVAGAEKGQQPPQPAAALGHRHAGIHPPQAGPGGRRRLLPGRLDVAGGFFHGGLMRQGRTTLWRI